MSRKIATDADLCELAIANDWRYPRRLCTIWDSFRSLNDCKDTTRNGACGKSSSSLVIASSIPPLQLARHHRKANDFSTVLFSCNLPNI